MPDENEVYLAVPYLNEDGLELYTRLILRKLVSLVISSNTNIHDYEQEYSATPEVKVVTIGNDIEKDEIYNLPLSYGVGSHQLRITVSGYMMYPGVDYEEVGEEGQTSNQIKFLTSIEAGSILGAIVYPKQFSFGRNINVSNLVAPSLAISDDPSSLLSLDENDKAIVEASKVQAIVDSNDERCLHIEGEETVVGQKTFISPLKIDLSAADLSDGETQTALEVSFKANGMDYDLKPIHVVAGSQTDEPYSGALMFGSNTGCTWIGSGESLLALPTLFSADGIDFANDESVIITSDSKISFYSGCINEGINYIKAAEFLPDGSTRIYGPAYAPTPPLGDHSTRIATTEFVKIASISVDEEQEITGQKTFTTSPIVPTPDVEEFGNLAASTQFVKDAAVLLYEDQDVSGEKRFLSDVTVYNSAPVLELSSTTASKGVSPENRIESGIEISDRIGHPLGSIVHRYETTGESTVILKAAVASAPDANTFASMGISVDTEGHAKTFAPNPPVGDSSTRIATTKFVYDTLASFKEALVNALREKLVSGIIEEEDDDGLPDPFDFAWEPSNSVDAPSELDTYPDPEPDPEPEPEPDPEPDPEPSPDTEPIDEP